MPDFINSRHEPSDETPPGFSTKRIKALIQLLSDRDERIAQTIQDELVTIGVTAMSLLKQAERDFPDIALRVTDVIQSIRFKEIEQAFLDLVSEREEPFSLERGAFLLARYAYPHLDVSHYHNQLDEWADHLWELVRQKQAPKEAIMVVSQYLFDEQGFQGNSKKYYDPDNSYLNRVIDRRLGIPISLSVLFILVAQRLDLPVAGIGMPGHFLVKLTTDGPFMDCFNRGAVLSQANCERFLEEAGHEVSPHYFDPSPSHMILARMVRNLVGIYDHRQEFTRRDQLKRLLDILEQRENFLTF